MSGPPPSTKVTINNTKFDFSRAAPVASATGCDRTRREGLSDEALVKFREMVVKKILKNKVSANLHASSFKPSELDSKGNFFYAIGEWSAASLQFESWLRSNFLHTVFTIIEPNFDPATRAVTGLSQKGDLFKNWNALTLTEVYQSCDAYAKFSESAVEPQNLNLTYEFLLANIDDDLRATVLAELSRFIAIDPDVARSGPMVYHIITNRIVRNSDAISHNVVTGLMTMGLVHFKNEDVVSCVATLRHVLTFLGHGTPNSMCPPTIMTILTDIFLRCTNTVFVNHIRGLSEFHEAKVDTPEKLFAEAQTYYNKLYSKPNGWLRSTKLKSAFLAENPELAAIMSQEEMSKPEPKKSPPSSTTQQPKSDKNNKTVPDRDRQGRLIDRNAPKPGEPTKRQNENGFQEHWCGKCYGGGRWGNHDTEHHDEWVKRMKEQRNNNKSSEQTTNASTNPPSMHRSTDSTKSSSSANVCIPSFNYLRGSGVADFAYDSDQSF